MPLQWRNQIWQSLEEGAGKRCSECVWGLVHRSVYGVLSSSPSDSHTFVAFLQGRWKGGWGGECEQRVGLAVVGGGGGGGGVSRRERSQRRCRYALAGPLPSSWRCDVCLFRGLCVAAPVEVTAIALSGLVRFV